MRVLVTGGAGFIGSHVCDALIARGCEVVALDNLDPQVHPTMKWPEYQPDHPKLEKVILDIAAQDAWPLYKIIRDGSFDAVVHLAAKVGVGQSATAPGEYTRVNAYGTAQLLDVMGVLLDHDRRPKRLVVASSMSCYGEGYYRYLDDERARNLGFDRPALRSVEDLRAGRWEYAGLEPAPIPESEHLAPTSIYAETKATTERMSLIWGSQYGAPTTACRFFNVYGPRQALTNPYTGVAAIFASAALRSEPAVVYEDGLQSRDFVHVLDVAQAVADLATRSNYHGPVNVCTGRPTTILQVAQEIRRLVPDAPEPRIPGKFRAGDIRHCIGDCKLLSKLVPWMPRPMDEAQFRALLAWARKQDTSVDNDPHAELEHAGLVTEVQR